MIFIFYELLFLLYNSIIMGANTNEGYRVGAVKDRSQIYNPLTQKYVKRDTTTGKFLSSSDTKYKGIKLEKSK